MSFEIDATGFNGRVTRVNIDIHDPDYCPICHKHVSPSHLGSYLDGDDDRSYWLQRVYRCTNSRCGSIFLALYKGVKQSGSFGKCWYFYKRVEPGYPQDPNIPENVGNLSKSFCEIYKQSSYAESYGLSDICGVGYRKSLEFLVKDFCISKSEELGLDEETIKKTSLYNCIINYINDPMTQSVAKRATWLGNDETHYLRKWEDKDIQDLKTLLQLTINSIENQLLAEAYESEMGGK